VPADTFGATSYFIQQLVRYFLLGEDFDPFRLRLAADEFLIQFYKKFIIQARIFVPR